mgnify:CR=1 FL=1
MDKDSDENNNEENKAVYSNILKLGEMGRFVRLILIVRMLKLEKSKFIKEILLQVLLLI